MASNSHGEVPLLAFGCCVVIRSAGGGVPCEWESGKARSCLDDSLARCNDKEVKHGNSLTQKERSV